MEIAFIVLKGRKLAVPDDPEFFQVHGTWRLRLHEPNATAYLKLEDLDGPLLQLAASRAVVVWEAKEKKLARSSYDTIAQGREMAWKADECRRYAEEWRALT